MATIGLAFRITLLSTKEDRDKGLKLDLLIHNNQLYID